MRGLFSRLVRDESGEDLIEYGLLVAMAAIVASAAVISDPLGIGGALTNAFEKARDAVMQAGA